MREQLIQYVQLLFAGVEDCDDIRQEILQNTLDRYDDLIAAGKTPEAAYRLAIMGIGDINEILGRTSGTPAVMPVPAVSPGKAGHPDEENSPRHWSGTVHSLPPSAIQRRRNRRPVRDADLHCHRHGTGDSWGEEGRLGIKVRHG